MHSILAVNAQDKSKKVQHQQKIEEVKIVELHEDDISIGTEVPYINDIKQDPNHVYYVAEVQVKPEFTGGIGAFVSELLKAVSVKDNGAPSTFKARVYISFVIEIDGTISSVKLLRDPGYGFGKEVTEAAKSVRTKWSPGIINGKPVRVSYSIPVVVEVEE